MYAWSTLSGQCTHSVGVVVTGTAVGVMSILDRGVEQREPVLVLKVDVTATFNEHLRDRRMPIFGRDAERCVPRLHLNIDVAASFNQLFCDSLTPICCRDYERSGPKRVLVVDPGLCACRKQHLPNSHCIVIARSQKE